MCHRAKINPIECAIAEDVEVGGRQVGSGSAKSVLTTGYFRRLKWHDFTDPDLGM